MKTKLIFIAMALILAVGSASAYIPTIEADTIFKGFDSGTVTGIVFANEGKSVIVMHNAQPVEIDIETHKIVREFEAVPNATSLGSEMTYIKSKKYLTATIKASNLDGNLYFDGTIVWNYSNGKIIRYMQREYVISNDEHTYVWNKSEEIVYEYDQTNFTKIDSMKLKQMIKWYLNTWQHPAIIPNTRKILFNIYLDRPDNYGNRTFEGTALYTIDFNTKEFTNIKNPNNIEVLGFMISKINFTENGKYLLIEKKIEINQCQFMIYDSNLNFLYEIKYEDWPNLAGLEVAYAPMFINSFDDDYLIFGVNSDINDYTACKTICLNIAEQKVYKHLALTGINYDWDDNCFGKYDKLTNKLSLVNERGVVGLFDDEITPVKETSKPPSLEIKYRNNQLEFYSDKSFAGQTQIYDLAGKLVFDLGSQEFVNGKNIIPVEQTLSVGIYFLSIENGTEHVSGKFLVE